MVRIKKCEHVHFWRSSGGVGGSVGSGGGCGGGGGDDDDVSGTSRMWIAADSHSQAA